MRTWGLRRIAHLWRVARNKAEWAVFMLRSIHAEVFEFYSGRIYQGEPDQICHLKGSLWQQNGEPRLGSGRLIRRFLER